VLVKHCSHSVLVRIDSPKAPSSARDRWPIAARVPWPSAGVRPVRVPHSALFES